MALGGLATCRPVQPTALDIPALARGPCSLASDQQMPDAWEHPRVKRQSSSLGMARPGLSPRLVSLAVLTTLSALYGRPPPEPSPQVPIGLNIKPRVLSPPWPKPNSCGS